MELLEPVGAIELREGGYGLRLKTAAGLPVLSSDKVLDDLVEEKLKWKIGVSVSSGCPVGCIYCFTNRFPIFQTLSSKEIIAQVDYVRANSPHKGNYFDEVKIEFKEMGDPLGNPDNVVDAIDKLYLRGGEYQNMLYVVSTSGPRQNISFFDSLSSLSNKGAKIRLQFSCHTTSDSKRKELSPKLDMMSFREISDIVEKWQHDRTIIDQACSRSTLTYVPFQGYELDAGKIRDTFNQPSVLIKMSYVDITRATKKNNLYDMEQKRVDMFIENLHKYGYQVLMRNR